VLAPRAGFDQRFLVGSPGDLAGRAEDCPARVVRNFEGERGGLAPARRHGCRKGGGHRGGHRLGFEEDGAPRSAVLLCHFGQFPGHHLTQEHVGGQDRLELGDFAAQFVLLFFEFDA
jgi:hypothetical protein